VKKYVRAARLVLNKTEAASLHPNFQSSGRHKTLSQGFEGSRSLAPAPPPFWGMNTIPAASSV
jgi:hypothetical protein